MKNNVSCKRTIKTTKAKTSYELLRERARELTKKTRVNHYVGFDRNGCCVIMTIPNS